MPWAKKWPVQTNLPCFAVRGSRIRPTKNSKNAFRPVLVQKFTFPAKLSVCAPYLPRGPSWRLPRHLSLPTSQFTVCTSRLARLRLLSIPEGLPKRSPWTATAKPFSVLGCPKAALSAHQQIIAGMPSLLSGPLRLRRQSRSRTRLRIAASIAFSFRACFKEVWDT